MTEFGEQLYYLASYLHVLQSDSCMQVLTHTDALITCFVVSQVEGDTVTFSFEMRSGREHNTPDKAMWGFSCTVRAQASTFVK